LIADDDAISRKMLEVVLTQWGYDVTVACDGLEAWRELQDNAPELAILDWVMPGMEGPQICEAFRRRQHGKYVYILLLTAKTNKKDTIRGLEAGADDCLLKPFDPLELQARLIAGRRILELQEELIAARELLRHQATRDAMTGAWNRRGIMEGLERELSRSRREGKPLAVLLADLDHFKRINDTFGHLAGDAVLREVARKMDSSARPYDLLGRYGGEEFLIILPGCDASNLANTGNRIRQRVAEVPVKHSEVYIPVTISMGGAVLGPRDQGEIHQLLHAADLALYRAKQNGRNRVELGTLRGLSSPTTETLPDLSLV
jgi:diguanylate cyclase (GGDEF)-like protein